MEYLYERGLIEIVNPEDMTRGQPARYRISRNEMLTTRELETNLYKHTGVQENM